MNDLGQEKNPKSSPSFSQREQEILEFWEREKVFEQSLNKEHPKGNFVFYDGPPFASGLPHYGHILVSVIKDTVLRYKTMRGYRVDRTVGWDTHGLPVETIAEKELNVKSKRDIVHLEPTEAASIAKFNEACRGIVFRYVEEWKTTLSRIGRWASYDEQYATLDRSYTESVWWVFKQLYDKGLIYKDYRVTPYCPRCETPLSNFEVNQGYQTKQDPSVFVLFKVKDRDASLLAWTTTPWTLPANFALAVGADLTYSELRIDGAGGTIILASDRVTDVIGDTPHKIIRTYKGKELVGWSYEPLPYTKIDGDAHHVVAGGFVTTQDGSGIVHLAPFGDDDYRMAKAEKLNFVVNVDLSGRFTDTTPQFKGEFVINANEKIIADLKERRLLFAERTITHEYPFCYRCDSPLLYYPIDAWYVAVTKFRDQLVSSNRQQINWQPEHVRDGRFGKWLEGARDWAISRNRYWGAPLPVWECEKCLEFKVIGSEAELPEPLKDVHRPHIDSVTFSCTCGGTMHRIPEVFDCWFESGSMPYGQWHYPFENKTKLEGNFPADFIAEALDQTRGWFYTLHVLATALTLEPSSISGKQNQPAYKNVIVNGLILASDGKKLSKRLKNYTPPEELFQKFGVDPLRHFLLTSTPIGEDYRFSDDGVAESLRKVIMILGNVVSFYKLYEDKATREGDSFRPVHVLDGWILSELNRLIRQTADYYDHYDLTRGTRLIQDFVNNLSVWYLKLSRDRFKLSPEEDKIGLAKSAINTLRTVLKNLAQVIAPSMPFTAEMIWRDVVGEGSVHLSDWPTVEVDENFHVGEAFRQAQKIIEFGRALRTEAGINIRQPLSKLHIEYNGGEWRSSSVGKENLIFLEKFGGKKVPLTIGDVVLDALNVQRFSVEQIPNSPTKKDWEISVSVDFTIDDSLRAEGYIRNFIRQVNNLRKESGLTIKDVVGLCVDGPKEITDIISSRSTEIAPKVIASRIAVGRIDTPISTTITVGDHGVWVGLEKSNRQT